MSRNNGDEAKTKRKAKFRKAWCNMVILFYHIVGRPMFKLLLNHVFLFDCDVNRNSKWRKLFHFICLPTVYMEFSYSEILEFLHFPAINAYLFLWWQLLFPGFKNHINSSFSVSIKVLKLCHVPKWPHY